MDKSIKNKWIDTKSFFPDHGVLVFISTDENKIHLSRLIYDSESGSMWQNNDGTILAPEKVKKWLWFTYIEEK